MSTRILAGVVIAAVMAPWPALTAATTPDRTHLSRARAYLAAGDYRRAIEACQRYIDQSPSAEGYVYLTYVYQAIDGYLEHLSQTDRWVGVEQLYLNLGASGTQDLTDPPDVLARIAKEIIQGSVRQQSDIAAAMATRLDKQVTETLWTQQTAWRKAHADSWWTGVPPEWHW